MKNKPDGLFFNRQFCVGAPQNCCDRSEKIACAIFARGRSKGRSDMEEKMGNSSGEEIKQAEWISAPRPENRCRCSGGTCFRSINRPWLRSRCADRVEANTLTPAGTCRVRWERKERWREGSGKRNRKEACHLKM